MDRAALRSVEHKPGVPAELAALPDGAAGLLVEFQRRDEAARADLETVAGAATSPLALLHAPRFTHDAAEQARLWTVRKGMFPSVGAVRRSGTTVIIEDVAFPVERLAEAALDLTSLFHAHGYDNAIIFGHAKDGNLHFVLTQSFNDRQAIDQYARFMDDARPAGRRSLRRGPQGRARHGPQHGAVRRGRVGRGGHGGHAPAQGARRPGRPAQPRRHPESQPAGAPRAPQAAPVGGARGGQVHRVRLLRVALPEPRAHADAAPAHRRPAGDRAVCPASGATRRGRPRRARAGVSLPGPRHLCGGRPVRDGVPGGHRHGRSSRSDSARRPIPARRGPPRAWCARHFGHRRAGGAGRAEHGRPRRIGARTGGARLGHARRRDDPGPDGPAVDRAHAAGGADVARPRAGA